MKMLYLLPFMAILGLFACAGPVSRPPVDIDTFSLEAPLILEKEALKAVLNPQNGDLFTLNVKNQEISIYYGDALKNVVGGLGTGEGNFLNLTDIALAPDGALFALDMASKRIRKFSGDGKLIENLDLQNSSQPALLTVGSDQTLYIFDQAASEIVVYSALDGKEQNRFGRFELQQLSSLSCNRDYVVGYDAVNNTSHVFSSLGQFVKSEPGQSIYDAYNNAINLDADGLKSVMSHAFLTIDGSGRMMSISGDTLLLTKGTEVLTLKIGYLKVE